MHFVYPLRVFESIKEDTAGPASKRAMQDPGEEHNSALLQGKITPLEGSISPLPDHSEDRESERELYCKVARKIHHSVTQVCDLLSRLLLNSFCLFLI